MSRKGHYLGGHTVFSSRNSSWFGFKLPKWAKKKATTTAKLTEAKKTGAKKARPKKKPVVPQPPRNLPSIKPEPSVLNREVTVVHQAGRKGKAGKPITVEYSSDRKRSLGPR